ncbi:hypothetical protein HU200_059524 [Digitaria exilis]|uniref:Uncharacterized protein n=1 Tax=Digitaria exilis TaxID=1010633 RepID=A0A835AI02_9POAL|nr:hypothetical protein HU200_059524 [Digitaria exilis]
MAHSPVQAPLPYLLDRAPIQRRTTCVPCFCCTDGDKSSCFHAPSCCIKLTCNGPEPIGVCMIEHLACNCNNCPVT